MSGEKKNDTYKIYSYYVWIYKYHTNRRTYVTLINSRLQFDEFSS